MKPDIIDKLFAQYYNIALLYSLSLCRNRAVAEDIVSVAFFKALQSPDDTITNFKAWLLTVCRNEYLDILRKESRMSGEELPEDLDDGQEQLIDGIIRKEEYKALYHAIDILPSVQKEVIVLFYFSGLSVSDISKVTGKSETNIKVILHRARESLKLLLGGTQE